MTLEEAAKKKCKGSAFAPRLWRAGFVAGAEYAIDKAVKFLYEHREEVQTEDNGISGWIPDELIMDFKQAMEL